VFFGEFPVGFVGERAETVKSKIFQGVREGAKFGGPKRIQGIATAR